MLRVKAFAQLPLVGRTLKLKRQHQGVIAQLLNLTRSLMIGQQFEG